MTPKILHDKILKKEIVVPDQWEIQILARILMKAEVVIVSELREDEIGNIGLKYARTVEDGIKIALKKAWSESENFNSPKRTSSSPPPKMKERFI